MTQDRKPPNAARRNQRSRQAILTATADLLGEVGYTKLAVEAIAARAGVGKQTIYRWWPDKGAVVLDAYLALVGAEQDLTVPDSGDLEADLRLVLGSLVDSLADPVFERRYRALLTAIQDDAGLAGALLDRLLKPWLEATKQRLRAAQQAGQLHNDVDLEVATELLYGPVYYRWLLRTGPISGEYVDAVVAMTLRALT
jgi:AcrR family transcriptional regulator